MFNYNIIRNMDHRFNTTLHGKNYRIALWDHGQSIIDGEWLMTMFIRLSIYMIIYNPGSHRRKLVKEY